jgi:hypothetical protein
LTVLYGIFVAMLTACQFSPVSSAVRSLTLSPSLSLGLPSRLPIARPLEAGLHPLADLRSGCASPSWQRDPSAGCAIEEVLDRCGVPLAAASREDAATVEFLGDPMKACRPFAADGLDYRHDAAHVTIRTDFHGRDGMGVPEAAERTRTIRVAELGPAGFGCCQGGRGSLGDHLAFVLGNGGKHMDG